MSEDLENTLVIRIKALDQCVPVIEVIIDLCKELQNN